MTLQPTRGTTVSLDGRYLYADAGAQLARNTFELTSQTAYMRRVGEANGWEPALILVVVDEAHLNEAGDRIKAALNGDAGAGRDV